MHSTKIDTYVPLAVNMPADWSQGKREAFVLAANEIINSIELPERIEDLVAAFDGRKPECTCCEEQCPCS